MTRIRTFDGSLYDIDAVARAKGDQTVSVCIPCRNEASTIGTLVAAIRTELVDLTRLVDELIVVDDRSTDDTAKIATDAGARVVSIEDVHDQFGEGHGKGNALWVSVVVSRGDIVTWIDGDLTSFEPNWIARLIGPLIDDSSIALVKAYAHRPQRMGGGGRTTELVARPLISMYFPELADLYQPLGGEYAVRRTIVEQLHLAEGWGVEMAMLIDIAARYGPRAIAQVDVGVREHRHQHLEALSVQAAEVIATILGRIPSGSLLGNAQPALRLPDNRQIALNLDERQPVASLSVRGNAAVGQRCQHGTTASH